MAALALPTVLQKRGVKRLAVSPEKRDIHSLKPRQRTFAETGQK
jgi:hypothetical protein